MATQLKVIQKFMSSLDRSEASGEDALNKAISAAFPRDGLKKFQALKEKFMNDLKGSSTASVPRLEGETDVEYFLRVYCGIDFKTKDSGAITGSDAGGSKTKTDDNIISESGTLKTTFQDKSFTVENLKVTLADKKAFSDLTAAQKFIWQGLYTWWVKDALDLVKESYGDNFSFKNFDKYEKYKSKYPDRINTSYPTTNQLYVKFINDADADKISVEPASYKKSDDGITAETTGITLTINMAYYNSLDTATANSEFDRTIAHAMTHVVMMANTLYLPLYRYLPGFITEGLAELTIGITNSNANKIKTLAADVTKYDVGLDANDLARDESFMYEGGYTFFRYLARQAGDLTIANSSTPNTLLLTFYGNDTITSSANNVTIQSGYGDDSIKAGGKKLTITCDGGNNSIYINKDSSNNKITTGKGKDFISLAANISNHTVSSGAGNDTINSACNAALIDAGAGNDRIFNTGASVSVDAGAGADYISNSNNFVTITAGAGNDTINNSASQVLINAGDSNDTVYLLASANKNTVNGGKGKDYIYVYTNSKNHRIDSGDGDDTVHSEGSNILISTGDGADIVQLYAGDSTAENNTINSGKGNDSIYSGGTNISVNADEGDDYIHVYSYANDVTINPGVGNDTIESYCTDGFLYQYKSGDGNDSVKGFSSKDTLNITGGTYSTTKSGNNIIVTVDKSKITLEGAATLKTLHIGTLSGGASTLTVTNSTSSPVTVGSAVKVIDASSRSKAVQITGNALDNTIRGGNKNDTLYGGKGNDSLIGGKGNDILFGQAGNDTLRGKDGNDTLTGGNGKDLFLCGAGNEVITDYETGDRISLASAVTKTTLSGSDVVFTMGSNSLTVKNVKGKSLSMINSAGKSFSTVIGSAAKTLTVTNSTSSPVTVDSSTEVIDASSRTKAIKITGNGLDNTIIGGSKNDSLYGDKGNDSLVGNAGNDKLYGNNGNDILVGGAGNDSLWGNVGNDSLYGGAGNDTFLYESGAGNDTIFDYQSGDVLRLLKADGSAGGKYKKSKFSNGTLTLTIKDGGSVIFENVTTATNFNINGNSYKVSGSKLAKN